MCGSDWGDMDGQRCLLQRSALTPGLSVLIRMACCFIYFERSQAACSRA